jgi:hypothetical protein
MQCDCLYPQLTGPVPVALDALPRSHRKPNPVVLTRAGSGILFRLISLEGGGTYRAPRIAGLLSVGHISVPYSAGARGDINQ